MNSFNKCINNIDNRGWTALHWACYFGYEQMVKLLIDNKAMLDIKTIEGLSNDSKYTNKTAKSIAKLRYNKKCAKMITNCKIKRRNKKVLDFIKSVLEFIQK